MLCVACCCIRRLTLIALQVLASGTTAPTYAVTSVVSPATPVKVSTPVTYTFTITRTTAVPAGGIPQPIICEFFNGEGTAPASAAAYWRVSTTIPDADTVVAVMAPGETTTTCTFTTYYTTVSAGGFTAKLMVFGESATAAPLLTSLSVTPSQLLAAVHSFATPMVVSK